jgi:WD40 repeat protein
VSEQTSAPAVEIPEQVDAASVLGCPYVGLVPYTERDSGYFFGRERDIGLIVDNLHAARLTILFGPTGVGKTSVLRAGVLCRLREESRESVERFGVLESAVAYCNSWRDDPLVELAVVLRQTLSEVGAGAHALTTPDGGLDADAVADACAETGLDLYLILDQFEEIFIYHDEQTLDRLARQLNRLIAPTVRVNLLIGIREDAMPRLDGFERYLPKLFGNFLRVDHLDAEAAREAVLGPLRRFNSKVAAEERMEIEPELVSTLIEQVQAGRVRVADISSDRPEKDDTEFRCRVETPFLQLVLIRLWEEERHRDSHTLRLGTLSGLGGAQSIVREHLDRVLRVFDDHERHLAALLFRHLVTPSGTKIALTAGDLADFVGHDAEAVTALLRRLCAGGARVLREIPPPMDSKAPSRYEVFHDVLAVAVADWRRRYVTEEERASSERQLRLEKEEAERTARQARARLRRARAVMATLAFLVILCMFLAWHAKTSATQAQQQTLLATVRSEQSADPAEALRDGLEAWGLGHIPAVGEALRAATDASLLQHTLRMGDREVIVTSARFSPDGKRVLTTSSDGRLAVWDAGTGAELVSARTGRSGSLWVAAAFNHDGTLATVGDADGDATVVDTSTGATRRLSADFSNVTRASFVGGGDEVLIHSPAGGPAQIWDGATGALLSRVGDEDTVAAAADQTGRYVATWDWDQTFRVWDWRRHVAVATRETSMAHIYQLGFLPEDRDRIVAADNNGVYLVVWDWRANKKPESQAVIGWHGFNDLRLGPANGQIVVAADKKAAVYRISDHPQADDVASMTTSIPDSGDWITTTDLSADGQWLAAAGNDGDVKIYLTGTANNRPVYELLGHQGGVWDVRFSPDGRRLVTAAADGTARLWQLPEPVRVRHGDWVLGTAFSPDGRHIATVSNDGGASGTQVSIWNVGTGRREAALPVTLSDIDDLARGVSWSPDGNAIATSTSNGTTPQVVRWRGPKAAVSFQQGHFFVNRVEWDPDPDRPLVVGGDRGNRVLGWDAGTGKIIWTTPLGSTSGSVNDVDFSGDGGLLAAGSEDGRIALLRPSDGKVLRVLSQPAGVNALALSRDGRYLATAGGDWVIRVWDLRDHDKAPKELHGQGSTVAAVDFDRTARFVVAGGAGATTQVWDRATGRTVALMKRHGDEINAVMFSPVDPLLLATGSDDGTTAVYRCDLCNVSDDRLADYARQRLPVTTSVH